MWLQAPIYNVESMECLRHLSPLFGARRATPFLWQEYLLMMWFTKRWTSCSIFTGCCRSKMSVQGSGFWILRNLLLLVSFHPLPVHPSLSRVSHPPFHTLIEITQLTDTPQMTWKISRWPQSSLGCDSYVLERGDPVACPLFLLASFSDSPFCKLLGSHLWANFPVDSSHVNIA